MVNLHVASSIMSIPSRSPWLLKRLLAQSSSTPGTPSVQRKATKRKIQLDSDLDGEQCEQSKKRKLDFIHNAHEALSQSDVSDELNICEYHCDKTSEQLLIVTTKAVYYHEPTKYLSHLRLIVTSSSGYYIQVDYPSCCQT